MSWMEKLYQTYEESMKLKAPPMPISHTPQNAHINIIIDGAGNFRSASVLEKTQIILPATEDSASRSSGEAPHPLADKLQYIAKDYADFGGQKKAYFASYETQLKKWCDSEQGHEQVKAVLRYVQKGSIIADLVERKILHLDADNQLLTTWEGQEGEQPLLFKVLPKEKGTLDQGSALVCWTVEKEGYKPSETWKDSTIQASWIAFDTTNGGEKGLCYITGQDCALSTKHPAKIRHSGDKAKLISSNDTSGYTYRGKFLEDNQACGIGFEVSQKAHNALAWLIQNQKQAFRNGDQVYVAWAVSGEATPELLKDSYSQMAENFDDEADVSENDAEEETVPSTEEAVNHAKDLGESYALKLKKYMAGYAAKLDEDKKEQIIIMGIDSATPGRMGIIYYREKNKREFLDCLEKWHEEFAWYQRYTQEIKNDTGKKPKTKVIYPESSPVPRDIAKAAYGENVSDDLKKKVIERLLPCIVDGLPFPRDLMQSCVRKATNRVAYANDEQWLWEKNLGITCALFKGYYARHPDTNQRRTFDMALEENYHSRDYLYGRLLAVAEWIEEDALKITGENRPTNAARLMQRFADHPAQTWLTIYKALDSYMQRLQVSPTGYLFYKKKELGDILEKFSLDDYNSNAPLSGEFLLGYYCQRQKRYTKSTTTGATPDDTTSAGDTE
ncbi:MAG: type I-C CRISPR-associated protein Cas8c/Csd1 [Methylococcales bacterium]|nr:type I-C CRISPR-associated protein Cas8c/Csd1 [Methylococcales bacterium]MDP3837435.1 type I-C CRISPR-associated protein Cas8c/Csd1 [Methylococcales bacterium]